MKKISVLMILLLLMGVFAGCASKEASETEAQSKSESQEVGELEPGKEPETEEPTYYNAVMITGGDDSILDGGMYQSAWKGLVSYAETEGVSYHYFGAATEEKAAFSEQINRALEAGAKTILGFGNEMYDAVEEIAVENPQVEFCVIDVTGMGDAPDNVTVLQYDMMEAGFVAGYAAAMEGIDTFGFFSYGDMLENEYQYGFLQGLDVAGKYLTQTISRVYTVSFGASGEAETMREALQEWFVEDGVELVFCSADAQLICSEVAAQAQVSLITSGDKTLLTELAAVNGVITKNYEKAVYDYLYGLYGNGYHYLNMGNDMISYERNMEVFPALTEELETTLTGSIEAVEDYINRNVKISTADLGLEYVKFAY